MSEDATQYRVRAEEARQLAEKFKNPLDKEVWLHVAGEWLKLRRTSKCKRESNQKYSAETTY